MIFYPKNKIQTGLYTSGAEFIIKNTGKIYVGDYYKTFDGKFFTGDEPNAKSLELISFIDENLSYQEYNSFVYDNIKKINFLKSPVYKIFYPNVQEKDYSFGFIDRYFINRVNGNSSTIKEVNKQDYDKIKNNPLYKKITIKWKLVGYLHDFVENPYNPSYGVYDTNRRTVINAEKTFRDIIYYLNDYIEFARIIPTPEKQIKEEALVISTVLDGGELPPIPTNKFPDIYIGVNLTGNIPSEAEILSGNLIVANPADDIIADWTSLTTNEYKYSWFFIPYGAPANIKNKWEGLITLNTGYIGNPNDQWETLNSITVNGVSGYVCITPYPTKYSEIIKLRNV